LYLRKEKEKETDMKREHNESVQVSKKSTHTRTHTQCYKEKQKANIKNTRDRCSYVASSISKRHIQIKICLMKIFYIFLCILYMVFFRTYPNKYIVRKEKENNRNMCGCKSSSYIDFLLTT